MQKANIKAKAVIAMKGIFLMEDLPEESESSKKILANIKSRAIE